MIWILNIFLKNVRRCLQTLGKPCQFFFTKLLFIFSILSDSFYKKKLSDKFDLFSHSCLCIRDVLRSEHIVLEVEYGEIIGKVIKEPFL